MDEKEYIERKSIVDSIRKRFDFHYQIPVDPSDREVQNIIKRVNRAVQEIPAADVVPRAEVVRVIDKIFDEVETCVIGIIEPSFQELRKKYTEGE